MAEFVVGVYIDVFSVLVYLFCVDPYQKVTLDFT